ncbi:hypothetical protein E4582_10925 [Luteimonas yindakuii]|uniref:Uncharacterized protein n=1 Tax=Luteimonas yindakuii TaxID=2565782 RepID=A0A4Z1RGD6_9GAMM|nr:hypothetical protein [Luteimonas yindakuii]TKS52751.1 hypothetical protein E4582_10925 [Luteimonas yindakuii]
MRGTAPVGALPGGIPAAVVAWLIALAVTSAAEAASPLPPAFTCTALLLAVEAALAWAVLALAARTPLRAQVLQALGLLAAVRNAVLVPVSLVLVADAGGAAPGTVLALAVLVGLATVAAMAVLVRRYLDLWQQALGRSRRVAGAVLLAMALVLLGVEAMPGGG